MQPNIQLAHFPFFDTFQIVLIVLSQRVAVDEEGARDFTEASVGLCQVVAVPYSFQFLGARALRYEKWKVSLFQGVSNLVDKPYSGVHPRILLNLSAAIEDVKCAV